MFELRTCRDPEGFKVGDAGYDPGFGVQDLGLGYTVQR